jgi:hypothetical protein
MPRNDRRVNQSSLDMLQSWRGNCDIQVLIYSTDPTDPDPGEIAQVVDYVIGYVCKGNQTFKEEITQYRSLIEKSNDDTSSSLDVIKLARKLLNKSASNRLISKQEAMVLLLELDLVMCSDRFDLINISSSAVVKARSNQKSILSNYKFRTDNKQCTLHEYYHMKKQQDSTMTKSLWYIPIYTGANTKPTYPPQFGYAKTQILIHSAWNYNFEFPEENWQDVFQMFLSSKRCPACVKIPYQRSMLIHFAQLRSSEPKSKQTELDLNMTTDEEELLQLTHCHMDEKDINSEACFDFGLEYQWHHDLKVRK